MIKFRSKSTGAGAASSPKETIKYCEQYRAQLTNYCMQYFECEREYAEDCVQDAYLALLESLNNGIVIKNYKAWLYTVVLNYKNKAVKDKIKRNEAQFNSNVEKDKALEENAVFTPDYIEQMTTDAMIEEQALRIISQLDSKDKELYIAYYWHHKTLKDIATQTGTTYTAVRKRHEKLKKKIMSKIKNLENF